MKILVVNLKYLGDLIVSTPGLRSLRKAYPSAEIVLMVRKNFEEVLANNPNINRIITFDPNLKGNSNFDKFIKGIRFIKKIREGKFDTVIVLHPGDRTAFWAWLSGAKNRIAPRKQSFGFLFNHKVDVYEDSISYLDYYNKIIEAAGGSIDSNKTEFFISQETEAWIDNFFAQGKINADNIVVAIHPGASEPTKIWKHNNFIQLIEKLISDKKYKVIIIEGPQDKEICSFLQKSFMSKESVFFAHGSIIQIATLIKRCNILLTHDTGTRHLAVAVGTQVLALIPDDNQKFWNFYSEVDKHYVLVGKRNHNNGKPYLDMISVVDVYNKIKSILDR